MSRLLRSAAAGLLTVVLCLGTSTGPVRADDQTPARTTTVAPSPTQTSPSGTTPPESTPPSPTSTSTSTTAESSPSVAPVAPATELADLQLRAWFEKPSYQATETITAHATVTNAGTATANGVVVTSTGNLGNDIWSPFFPLGVTVAPGETIERSLTGYLSADESAVRLTVTVAQRGGEPDANPADNTVSVSVPVVITRGNYRGTVYGDRDGNAALDPGEALAGVTVHITGGLPHVDRTQTTGPDGTFLFRDLPVGGYSTVVEAPGWYLPTVFAEVKGPDDPDVLIRVVREVAKSLTVSLAFSQQSYSLDDTATATLTLTNTSDVLLSDLVAECSLPYLYPDEADVGQLKPGSGGVTLPAGETRHYPIRVPVTERALMVGHVRLHCVVGAPPYTNGPSTTYDAIARVPGGVATRVVGRLILVKGQNPTEPPWGDPVPGVKVYLRDAVNEAIVARDVTDANGYFTFHDLPAGLYRLGVVGSWRWYQTPEIVVRAGENGSPHLVYVVAGPYQPDPDAAPPEVTPPGGGAPPNAPPPVLAATGAGVARLALSGLLTLLIGVGLVLIARRGPNDPGSRRT